MKILLMMSFLGLFGCENNTKEIQYSNFRIYFWPKIEKDAPCKYLTIGLPANPYLRKQDLKVFYKDGSSFALNQNNLLAFLKAKYGDPSKQVLDGKVGPAWHPGKSYNYPNGLISWNFRGVRVVFKEDEIWGISLNCENTQKIKEQGGEWENKNLPDNKFITHILINGKQIDLPIKEKALLDALGKPNNKLEYISQ